jgi:integrase
MAVFFMSQTKTRQEWSLALVAFRDAYTWHNESYTSTLVKFELPKLAKNRLPVLTADELRQIVKECNVRDKAIVLFMADSGLRRAEVWRPQLGRCGYAKRAYSSETGKEGSQRGNRCNY